ncbi:MAG: hypothetical protein E7812_18705 [Phenylobacterium sp.]|nr:MAG: hypothetical protein E7812_18705 [Phenylobacterium sp.]
MHSPILSPWIGIGFFLATCAAALWKGGRDERIVAVAFLLNTAISYALLDHRWSGTQWGEFVADAIFFLVLAVVALRSRSYWPIAAAGFQLLAILTHAASTVDRHLGAWAYITAGIIWTQLVTFSLAIGTYNHWRARRQLAAMDAAIADPGATRL